ncbi:MAG: hypothetical protein NXI24_15840 [bacterium]|nr:hypothetical protein [bacterium]
MEFAYVLPAAAFLADLAVLLFLVSDWRSGVDRPLLAMYVCLTGWNLCVALMISAPTPEQAWFYLFCMRNFLFLTPPAFLWFSLRVSGRSTRWPPLLALMYALAFMTLAASTYFSGSRLLIEEIRLYDWGYFPYTAPLARVLLGTLFAGCLLPAFIALLWPRKLPAEIQGRVRRARFWLPALFVTWWLSLLVASLPLTGIDIVPPGSAMDAIVGLTIAIYLRGRRSDTNGNRADDSANASGATQRRTVSSGFVRSTALFANLAGMLASLSFGVFVTFFFLEFLLPAQAVATGLAGAITAFVALLVFQRWFSGGSDSPGDFDHSGNARPANRNDDRPLFVKLQSDYGLTYQEAVICTQLHEGLRRSAIVTKLGVTNGTFRNHLSEVYRKTVDAIETPALRSRDKLQRLTVFLKNLDDS